jgi:hypothetical protein
VPSGAIGSDSDYLVNSAGPGLPMADQPTTQARTEFQAVRPKKKQKEDL